MSGKDSSRQVGGVTKRETKEAVGTKPGHLTSLHCPMKMLPSLIEHCWLISHHSGAKV